MAAELSLRFGATEDVSKAAKQAAAGIAGVDTALQKAGQTAKTAAANFDQAGGKVVSLSGRVKGLKEPISNVAQLANAMGTAFGGAASKATGLINGVVSGFAGGGAMGLAIGATTGLVSVLIAKFQEAQEAAEKAAAARKEVFETEVDRINALITGYDDLIAKQKNAALGAFDVQKAALEAQIKGAQASQQILEQQRGSLLQNLENFREDLKQKGAYSAVDFEQLAVVKQFRAEAEALSKPIQEQGILVDRYTEAIERLNVAASKVAGRSLAGKVGAAGKKGGSTRDEGPTVVGNTTIFDIPEMELEEQGRAQVRAYAKGIREAEEKVQRERQRRLAKDAERAAKLSEEAAERAALDAKRKAEEELADQENAAKAGTAFATSWAKAIKDGISSGDPMSFLKGAAMAVGQLLGAFVPGIGGILGGGIFSLIGSVLRTGGESHQVVIPKARRGIAMLDMDSDGQIIEGHPGEVMWNAEAVAKNGGIDRVARQNNPLEPPMAAQGGGYGVVINLSTLTPKSSREAVVSVLEPVLGQRLRANQGKYTADLRRRFRRRAR